MKTRRPFTRLINALLLVASACHITAAESSVKEDAQMAVGNPQAYPEFAGNVISTDTRPMVHPGDRSPGGRDHFRGNAGSYLEIGAARAEAILKLGKPISRNTITATDKPIKAYCLDFNWVGRARRKRFAPPGTWAGADPAAHVAWYKAMGANVIQTFCLSNNGYAWYKNGIVPEQPGLKHDFLAEVVRLGHNENMLVFGYFCAQANGKWCKDHPDQTYGEGGHSIVFTDSYLDYLSKAIADALNKTGIDGFMVDWMWMPSRRSTKGKWIEAEKNLYAQLMGEPFPGEDNLGEKEGIYSRKAIDRCWKAIRQAAIDANPDCIIWLTVNNLRHPHIAGSDMLKEADWLMNEAGDMRGIEKARAMIGEHTRLITCMAAWNGQDAAERVPEALAAGVGLYGFTMPAKGDGRVPLESIFSAQISQLSGDARNIAVLARAYHGMSVDAVWKDGKFIEPDPPPPFRVSFARRGRGHQDTASLRYDTGTATVSVTTPYNKGKGHLKRIGDAVWPKHLAVRLQKRPGTAAAARVFRMHNGRSGFLVLLADSKRGLYGTLDEEPVLKGGRIPADSADEKGVKYEEIPVSVSVKRTDSFVEITIPPVIGADSAETLVFDWGP